MITALSQQILGNLQSATRQSWLMTVFGIVMIACGICTFSLVLLLPLKQLNQAMLSIEAQSNLNQRLDETGQDEFSEIATSFNRFVAKMRSMVELVIDASRNLTAESFKLSDLSLVSHRYVTEQKASLDACGTDLQTVTTTVESIAKDSQETLAAAQQASDQAASARRLVSDVIDQIGVLAGQVGHAMVSVEQLRTLSESIEEVMHIIRGITEQTNLLALNAAIEAARAGEQGRGFAVVAEEVRGMSCQVQSQTETIQAKIRALQEHVAPLVITMQTGNEMAQRSVGMAQAAGQGLQTITVAMERIIAMNAGIVDKVGQHHELVSRLSQAISAIGEMAQGSAVSSSQSAELAKEFNFLAKQLEQLVEQFVRHQSLARATLPAASWAHGSQAGDEDVELF